MRHTHVRGRPIASLPWHAIGIVPTVVIVITTAAGIDPLAAPWLGVVAESGCRYYAELKFPDPLAVGLAVERLGRTSVTYRLGVFPTPHDPAGASDHPVAAVGHWVHVYVDRATRRPIPIPDQIRVLLEGAKKPSS